jgi:triosephosphate isomerase
MEYVRTPLVAGNWKMTASLAAGEELAAEVVAGAGQVAGVELLLCPPAPLLTAVASRLAGSPVALGAQDLHWEQDGAFTGAISPRMVLEAGCTFALVGHSERRHVFGETDEVVGRKVAAAAREGLCPILCVGETAEQRQAGETEKVVQGQLEEGLRALPAGARVVVAYEPVWAIGTGQAATAEIAAGAHEHLRAILARLLGEQGAQEIRILYGGSVTAANAQEFLGAGSPEDIDGVLVGGASRRAPEFLAIARAARERCPPGRTPN